MSSQMRSDSYYLGNNYLDFWTTTRSGVEIIQTRCSAAAFDAFYIIRGCLDVQKLISIF